MAGRVNKKFVFGLVGAAVVVLGAGLFLFWKMVNKTGETHAAVAEQLEAENDWRMAEEAWGRAVGHEKTNLEWLRRWRNALEHVVPNTRTEYQNLFAEYVRISRQIASVARDERAVTEEYMDIRLAFLRRLGTADRPTVEGISSEMESLLVWYPEGGALASDRDRLRRYRGIAWAGLAGPLSTITEEEIESAKADLAAALSADPGDGESARSLVTLLDTQEIRARNAEQSDRVAALNAEKKAVIAGVLEADPEDGWARISELELAVEDANKVLGEARPAAMAEMVGRLDRLTDWLVENAGSVDPRVFERVSILEGLLDPEGGAARTVRVYEAAMAATGEQSDMLLQLAGAYDRAGDYAKAVASLETLESQERLPVSVEGILRMSFKQRAPMLLAEFTLSEMGNVEGVGEKERLLEVARSARERFVALNGEDTPAVPMLDGQLAVAEAELGGLANDLRAVSDALGRALGYFARYNELTEYSSTQGLWREGRVATRLNKTGLARDRFEQMLQLDPDNPNVLLALAEVEEKLGTMTSLKKALSLTEQALDKAPASEAILERVERLKRLTFETVSDDPIEAIVFEAERLMQGVDEREPDALAAERLLRDAWAENAGDARVAQQLVRVLMFSDRFDEAKAFVEDARAAHPDEPKIQMLATRLEADSLLDIVILGIEESQTTELNKLLEKIETYRRYDEPELAMATLAEAEQIAPDDPDVVEQRFLQQIAAGDFVAAEATADRAGALDADRLGGLTYQARLVAARGEHARAVELLTEAVAERATDAPLWRLLASQQVELGRINEALDSYRRALAITESDTTTIRGYIATLATQGRMTEALGEARRLKEFGEADPVFLDLYLRLEASEGGEEGLATAIARRRQILGSRPFDVGNKLELVNLYIEGRRWGDADELLSQIESDSGKTLAWVATRARWFADQGRVRTADGFEDGIDLARGAFVDYIVTADVEESESVDAYLAMARFMLERGRSDVALRAIEEARPLQDPTRLRAEKLYGEMMMNRNIPRVAAEAFQKVVDAGADDGRDTYRKLLVEMLLRSNEFEAASAQIEALAEENASDLTVLMQRADIAMFRGDSEEALRIVDLAIEEHPSQPLRSSSGPST
jgi:tetratricopeptide (TPR) repeat protein